MERTRQTSVEGTLRDKLARANRVLSGVPPVIAHLLESPGAGLVNDAIVARLRGMIDHLALQMLAMAGRDPAERPQRDAIDHLADRFAADSAILSHLYALAMEGHLADRLEQRTALDPVLSALLQELIASDNSATAATAMRALSAQSRFIQSQRRMQLPIGELPRDLLDRAIDCHQAAFGADAGEGIAAFMGEDDGSGGRLALLAELVRQMGSGAVAALDLSHAGLALFAQSLAMLADQPRDLTILACHEQQTTRLAVCLRAAGQGSGAIERQLVLLAPGERPLPRIAELSQQSARSLLDTDSQGSA